MFDPPYSLLIEFKPNEGSFPGEECYWRVFYIPILEFIISLL
jgi:hypothetical protein